jgi:hypothetical protein
MRCTPLVLGAVLLAACGSNTATAPRLLVGLSGPSTVQGALDTVNAQEVYLCDFTLTATAAGGRPGDAATWTGGHDTFLHQDGSSTSHALSTASVAELLDGNQAVPAGTAVSGNDFFYTQTDHPFRLDLVFYYSTPRSATDSASYTMSCQ